MDTAIIVALIAGAATVIAAAIAILPKWMRKEPANPRLPSSAPVSEGSAGSVARIVFYFYCVRLCPDVNSKRPKVERGHPSY